MKDIRIYALHPYCYDAKSTINYLMLGEIERYFNFIWDNKSPEYLITTEHIHFNSIYRKEFNKIISNSLIVVFFTREAMTPDFNLCDYAIGFDTKLSFGDRYCPLPTALELYPKFFTNNINEIDSEKKAKKLLYKKKYFCNFLYSNPTAHPNRDKLFYLLSSYKRVDSLGRHLNNVKQMGTGYVGNENSCIAIKSPYKFSIASENAEFPGYTSEKILTSLASHTVPIYFGDKNIEDIINPKCFINCNKFSNLNEVIDIVKEIDESDKLWTEMISSPWQTENQYQYSQKRHQNYINFFKNIFEQKISLAKRRPIGSEPDAYLYQFIKGKIFKRNIYYRIYIKYIKPYILKNNFNLI